MADYEVGVRLVAKDETGPAVSTAQRGMKGVDDAAKSANKELEGMGPAAKKGADMATPALNGLKNSLGDILKMAAGFSIGAFTAQLGGSLTGALQESITSTKDLYSQVKMLQNITGGSAEQISTTIGAFEHFGLSTQQAASSISIFSRQMQKAPVDMQELATSLDSTTGKPLKGFADQMHDLGVNTEDATGKARPMLDVLMDTADKFKAMGGGAEATAAAMTLFGRSGRDMLPVLLQGSEGIKKIAEEGKAMGFVLTDDDMTAVKAFSAAQKDLNETMDGFKIQLGIALMPLLTMLASVGDQLAIMFNTHMLPAIKTVAEWIKNLVGNVQDAWKRFTEWLGPLGMVVDALKDFISNIIDAVQNNEGLSISIQNGAIAIGGATVATLGLGVAMDALASTASTATSIIQTFNAILETTSKTGTLIMIFFALAAVMVTLYQTVPQVTDVFNALWEAITGDPGALGVVYDVIQKTFGTEMADKLNPFLNWLMKSIPLIKDFGRAVVVAFTDDAGAMGVIYDVIRKVFGDQAAEAMQPFLQNLMLLIPRAKEAGEWIGWAFERLTKGDIRNVLIDLGIAFGKLFNVDTSGFAATVGKVFDTLGKLFEQFQKDPGGTLQAAWKGLQDILEPLAPSFNNLKDAFEKIVGAVQSLWPTPLKDILDGLGKADFSGVAPTIDAARIAFEGLYAVFMLIAGIINTITGFFDWIITNVGNATQFIKDHKEAQGALVLILGALAGAALNVAFSLAVAGAAMLLTAGYGGILNGIMTVMVVVVDAVRFAWMLMDAAMLANPIGLIIIALVALGAYLVWAYNNVDWFRDAVNNLWKAMQDWWAWFSTELMRELHALGDLFQQLGTWISENGDTIKTVIEALMGPPGLLLIAWQQDWGGIQEKVQGFVDWFKTVPGMISSAAQAVGNAFSTIGTAISNALKNINIDIGPFHWRGGTFSSDIPGISVIGDAFSAGGTKVHEALDTLGQQNAQANASSYSLVGELAGGPTPAEAGLQIMQTGGWLREPIIGVGPSGTQYRLHANEYISPAGAHAENAAAAHAGRGGGVTLNVSPGAVQISGANGPAQDWATAADALWDDLYAKLSRALDNRVS